MPRPPQAPLAAAGLLGACLGRGTPSTLGRRFVSVSVSVSALRDARLSTQPHAVRQLFVSSNRLPHAPRRNLHGSSHARQLHGSASTTAPSATVRDGVLSLEFGGADQTPLDVSLLWLRDVCACAKCVDADSGQKSFSTSELPDAPAVQSAELAADGSLRVVWAGDTHASAWTRQDVQGWRRDHGGVRTPHALPVARTFWDRSAYEGLLARGECRVSYREWTQDAGAFWRAFAALCETGLIFVTDVPDGEQEVEHVANQIGILQHTFYGFTWDVKSKAHAENVAYTSQFLCLHQDLMYNVPVPRLQLLHCLANSCDGGESLFSDGVRAAYELRLARPDLYDVLTQPMVHFHYDKEPHRYEMVRSTVAETAGGLTELTHWSPPFQAPFRREPAGGAADEKYTLAKWKQAAAAFQASLEAPENMVEAKLKPGECIVFDNWRVHHGRREFATGQGSRWLKGTYVSDQVHRAMEDRLQKRNGNVLPDIAKFRSRLASKEMDRVASLLKTPGRG